MSGDGAHEAAGGPPDDPAAGLAAGADAASARGIAVRTTLAAVAAELAGDWDEVDFLTRTVPWLPEPAEVAWASMYLVKANLALVDPVPDPDEAAAAGSLCASHERAHDGAERVASAVLSTAALSLGRRGPAVDPAPALVASTGVLLAHEPNPAWFTASGLFAAAAYAFVRSSMSFGVDPLQKVRSLVERLS